MGEQTWTPVGSSTVSSSNAPVLGGSNLARSNKGSTLDKDSFLLLLVTQMQNQDPMNPMDDKETVAQLAQFSALEQMQNLNKSATQTQAYSMLGKIAVADTYNSSGQSERIVGTVDSVSIKNGETYLTIGGTEVKISEISSVYDTSDTQLDLINGNISSLQSISLVNKTVQAIIFDEEDNATEFVEGKVDYMKVTEGEIILVIGNKNVFLSNVVSVAEDALLIGKDISASITNSDGELEAIEGKIASVKLDGDKRYLVIDGKNIEIENISDVTEAISLVGKELTVNDVSGVVSGVVIRYGKPVLLIGESEIALEDAKAA